MKVLLLASVCALSAISVLGQASTDAKPTPSSATTPGPGLAKDAPKKTVNLTKEESNELALSQANITIMQQQYQLLKDQLDKLNASQKDMEKQFNDLVAEQNAVKEKLAQAHSFPNKPETQYAQDQKTKLFTVTYSDVAKEEKK
jgi:septal ring factor EnvC (AmiA/AmiB activator)